MVSTQNIVRPNAMIKTQDVWSTANIRRRNITNYDSNYNNNVFRPGTSSATAATVDFASQSYAMTPGTHSRAKSIHHNTNV